MSDFKRSFARAVEVLLLISVLLIVAGQFVGYPIFIAFVETGSMSPAMQPGDGFISVPAPIAGSVEDGDVVVFRAKTIQGGGLTTHRVVGENEVGYLTKGDANPFTDQADGEPPVQRPQIVAEALQVGGTPVVIPQLGTGVLAIRDGVTTVQRTLAGRLGTRALLGGEGIGYLLLAGTVLYYVATGYLTDSTNEPGNRGSRRRRSGIDPRVVSLLFTLLVVCGATAAMVAPSGTHEYNLLATDSSSDLSYVVSVGGSETRPYVVENEGFVPAVAYLESTGDGIEIRPREVHVGARSETEATVEVHAPPRTGVFDGYVTEHRYLAVLPAPVLHALYTVHPWLPIAVIDTLVGVPFYLVGVALLGTGRIRERSKNRTLPLTVRLRRLLRAR